MRPLSRSQSAIRTPLNAIFGTEVNVRLLRVLVKTSVPMPPTQIAAAALVGLSGALRALGTLVDAGMVERVGSGGRQLFALRRRHPLASAIESLFAAEAGRFQRLLDALAAIAGRLRPPPKSVWLEGPVVTEDDKPGDAVHLAFLSTSSEVHSVAAAIQAECDPLERELDVTIDVHGLTEADLRATSPEAGRVFRDVVPLLGPPPAVFLDRDADRAPRSRRRRTHTDLDEDSRALASAIGRRIDRDPRLVERAKAFIRHRLATASPGERQELREWAALLSSASPSRLRHFLADPGERATRLRQTMPFLEVLSPDERARLRKEATRVRSKSRS